jgi:hypothetical protein
MKHKVINCPIVAARPVVWLAATRPAVESLRYRAFRPSVGYCLDDRGFGMFERKAKQLDVMTST